MVKPYKGRYYDDDLKDFTRWLRESTDEYIRILTPEEARRALSRLSMYDDDGHLIEE